MQSDRVISALFGSNYLLLLLPNIGELYDKLVIFHSEKKLRRWLTTDQNINALVIFTEK